MSTLENRAPYLTVVLLLIIGALLIVVGVRLDSTWLLWSGFFIAIPGVALTILLFLAYFWLKRTSHK